MLARYQSDAYTGHQRLFYNPPPLLNHVPTPNVLRKWANYSPLRQDALLHRGIVYMLAFQVQMAETKNLHCY